MTDNATKVDRNIGNAICTLLAITPDTAHRSRIGIALTCKRICHESDHDTDQTIGERLVTELGLHVKENQRVDTDGGDKTMIGLSRTVKRMIHEADYS